MDQVLYQALAARARGRCECCGEPFGSGFAAPTVDHFFGRSKANEVEFTCWVLRADHHRAKTDNYPSARHWLTKFIRHCGRWARKAPVLGSGPDGYAESALMAQSKLEWLTAKGTT